MIKNAASVLFSTAGLFLTMPPLSPPARLPARLSAGCQVCGGAQKAAAGLPSHGDEQTGPDAAGVCRASHQGDPAVSVAFLPVSGHAHTHAHTTHVQDGVWTSLFLFFCVCVKRQRYAGSHARLCLQNTDARGSGIWVEAQLRIVRSLL